MADENSFITRHSWVLFPLGLMMTIRISISLAISLAYFWNTHLKVRLVPRESMTKKYGQWGAVTGCTAGIGEQFAHEMASLGMDVVLISRSLDKLNKLADEIEKQYGVKTKVIVCDYLNRNASRVAAKLTEGMDIGIVVNNVGLNTDTCSRRFDEMTVEEVRNMTVVNAGAATLMAREFLPGMIARGRGCVLNIGSTSGYLPLPFQALYCGTKSYMRISSLALDKEINGSGVTIRCNIPQWIRTEMSKGNNFIYNLPFWTAQPRLYAYNSLLTLETPDMAGWWFFDFVIWFRDTLWKCLHYDLEGPFFYGNTSLLLKFSSSVKE